MDRNRTNGLQARQLKVRDLTEAELDLVSGGIEVTTLTAATSPTPLSPPSPPAGPLQVPYPNVSLS
jgi:hypothetical protein